MVSFPVGNVGRGHAPIGVPLHRQRAKAEQVRARFLALAETSGWTTPARTPPQIEVIV